MSSFLECIFLHFLLEMCFTLKDLQNAPKYIIVHGIHTSDIFEKKLEILCQAESICSDGQVSNIFISIGKVVQVERGEAAQIKGAASEQFQSHKNKCDQKQNKICIK